MVVSDFCKRYLKEYLSARWVLVMDWFISVFATFLVLELLNFFVRVGGRFFVVALIVSAVASFVMMLAFGTYRRAIRHTQLRDISRFGFMFMSAEVCVLVTLLLTFPNFWKVIVIGGVLDFCVSMVLTMGVRAFMMLLYMKISETQKENINRILVYRTGDKPVSLVKRLEQSPHYQLVGFLTRDKIENRMMVEGKPVFLIHDDYVPGDKKSSKYAASAPEFDGVLFEIFLCGCLDAVDSRSHFSYVQIHFHDAFLAPHPFNQKSVPSFYALTYPCVRAPGKAVLGGLL